MDTSSVATKTALLVAFALTAAVLTFAEQFSELPGVVVAFVAAGRVLRLGDRAERAIPADRPTGR